jgi:acetyl-CoA acetyltransferase
VVKHSAAVVGVGHSRVLRYDDVALGKLTLEACAAAIADAGLKVSDIDGVACAPLQPFDSESASYEGRDVVTINFVIRGLGLDVRWGQDVPGLAGQSFIEAVRAIEAGACDYALVFRSLHSPKGSYGFTRKAGSRGRRGQFSVSYGVTPLSMFAPWWHEYRDTYGTGSREQMATFVVQERKNGLLYEHGYWRQHKPAEVTVEDYLSSPIVSTPMCLLDCDIPVQGCAAFVLTTADRAADLPGPAAYVAGVSAPPLAASGRVAELTYAREREGGSRVARELWRDSGLGPGDVSVANLYDGFSIITMLWLEALGFCGPGEAFDFIQGGRIALDGQLPLNPSGGSLGAGRMHGAAHLVDSIQQVQDRAGARQVPGAQLALTSIGPASIGACILFARERFLPGLREMRKPND